MSGEDLATYLVPILTGVLGTTLGLLVSGFMSIIQQRNEVSRQILDQYFKVREELSDALSQLASLKVGSPISDATVQSLMTEVSRLTYKHYDFLTARVLQQLFCLHACLSDKDHRLYVCDGTLIRAVSRAETADFIKDVSLVDNFKLYALIPLTSSNDAIRQSAAMNCQARKVLRAMNADMTAGNLMAWSKQITKGKWR